MFLKLKKYSTNECEFILAAVQTGLRADGRRPMHARQTQVHVKRVSDTNSMAEATVGDTRVVSIVSCELTVPFADRPSEGFFTVSTEVMACASPSGQNASLQLVEKALKESRAIDVEGLCVAAGLRVWSIKCHIVRCPFFRQRTQ